MTTTAIGELRQLVEQFHAGSLVNAIDDISKRHGLPEMPPAATRAADALLDLIRMLDLDRSDVRGASEIWSAP